MSDINTISFSDIIKGHNCTVRVHDSMLYAVDLTMVVTGKSRDDSAKVLRDLKDEIFRQEKFSCRQLSTSGGHPTKLVSFKDAIELVMVLPGKVAKETRAQFAKIIQRYMAGDESMHAELESNAESISPVAQLARASLEAGPADVLSVERKRKREELEIAVMEREIAGMEREHIKDVMSCYRDVCSDSVMDERARLMFKDYFLNMTAQATRSAGLIANGDGAAAGVSANKPISLSTVAMDLGYRLTTAQAKAVGLQLRKKYVGEHGKPPSKHEQICDGRVTRVNSYTESDRPLMESVIQRFMDPQDESDGDE